MADIIFDFDGTLADTFPLVVTVAYELTGVRPLPDREVQKLRRLPLLKAVTSLGISPLLIPRLMLFTRPRMQDRMAEIDSFPGVIEAIKKLHADGHTLYILTSNRRRNVEVFLSARDLRRYFSDVVGVYYGNVFYKIYGLHKLLKRNRLRSETCVYVGNEPLDMRASHHAGVRAVAVTWSGNDRDGLAQTEPLAVIDKPKELLELSRQWK